MSIYVKTSQGASKIVDITDLGQAVSRLTNRKFVFIGDSYGVGTSQNASGQSTFYSSWIKQVTDRLGLVENSTYWQSSYGGVGFAAVSDGKTFTTLLTTLASSVPNKSDITDVVVCGGYNDNTYYNKLASIRSGIQTFVNAVSTNFPNAVIHIGFIGWTMDADRLMNLSAIRNVYYEASSYFHKNVYTLKGVHNILHHRSSMCPDLTHPSEEGYRLLGIGIANALVCGSCDVHYPWTEATFEKYASWSAKGRILQCVENDIVTIAGASGSASHSGVNFTFNGSTALSVAYINNTAFNGTPSAGNDSSFVGTTVNVVIHLTTGKYYNLPAKLAFMYAGSGKHYLSFYISAVNDAKSGWLSGTIDNIQWDRFTFSLNTASC